MLLYYNTWMMNQRYTGIFDKIKLTQEKYIFGRLLLCIQYNILVTRTSKLVDL